MTACRAHPGESDRAVGSRDRNFVKDSLEALAVNTEDTLRHLVVGGLYSVALYCTPTEGSMILVSCCEASTSSTSIN